MVTAVSTMSDRKYVVTTAVIIAKKMDSLVKMILNSISKIMMHYENTAESDLKNGTGGRKRKSKGLRVTFVIQNLFGKLSVCYFFRFALGCELSKTFARCWKSRWVYICVVEIFWWPSSSCTARRSPLDSSI